MFARHTGRHEETLLGTRRDDTSHLNLGRVAGCFRHPFAVRRRIQQLRRIRESLELRNAATTWQRGTGPGERRMQK